MVYNVGNIKSTQPIDYRDAYETYYSVYETIFFDDRH